MKIWGLLRKDQKIKRETIYDYDLPSVWTEAEVAKLINAPAAEFDISRPMVLDKHLFEIQRIGRVVFKEADFVDAFPYDTFEIEIIDEEKKKKNKNVHY